MTDYRSEYERYYKNINRSISQKQSKKYLFSGFRDRSSLNLPYASREYGGADYSSRSDRLVRKFIRQLEVSLALLAFVFGLKALPTPETSYVLNGTKYYLNMPFEYDQTIDAMNQMDVAGFKIENLHLENLKSQNIKNNLSEFMEYLKNVKDMNNVKVEN